MKTIDEYMNLPAGSFQKHIEEKQAKLDRYNNWKKEKIQAARKGEYYPDFPEEIELGELV